MFITCLPRERGSIQSEFSLRNYAGFGIIVFKETSHTMTNVKILIAYRLINRDREISRESLIERLVRRARLFSIGRRAFDP